MTVSRKIGIAALAFVASTSAHALEKVTFGTNWVAQAEHGGYYQALADGTYEACGLEVEIKPGGPQANNRILLPAGKIDFLMGGNMLQAFSAVEQGIPTVVVAAHFQKEPQILMTHPGEGLDTWDSLKGIKLLLGKGGLNSFYQWMKAEFGFTDEQVRPYTYNSAPFLADKQIGQQGYVTSEPFAVETEGGFTPNIFLIADYGYNTYATTVETRADLIESKPEAVKCFVEGSTIGWVNFLYGDNSKALELIKKDNPGMSDGQLAFSIEKLKEYGIVDSGDTLTMGIGAMTDERQKSFFDKMVKAGVVKSDIDYTKSYTLDFVNNGVGLDLKKKLSGN
ncbi:ABC transporter substrate-binding protein [Roseibium marinum]|uniref:NitT/TauT family transport system substrate-binding protein n=1 Tax=Roseibium marinum TaxID=281252 RepID=A0A2S3V2Q7_9HYPH|nr:ABC transporter substrate-binding protein [Roseibium marinum]POF34264.1 NitT/TauT family transport system substrate-binding protein [Roseibium marinum]